MATSSAWLQVCDKNKLLQQCRQLRSVWEAKNVLCITANIFLGPEDKNMTMISDKVLIKTIALEVDF